MMECSAPANRLCILFPINCQTFPALDQLQQQYSDGAHSESYNCLFKDTKVKNVMPDPDVPSGCDKNSPEYVLFV